jgi:hypothetical protein
VTIEELVRSKFKVVNVIGDELIIKCPYSGCSDSSGHMWINKERQVFHCWICERKGHITRLFEDFGIIHDIERESKKKKVVKAEKLELPEQFVKLDLYYHDRESMEDDIKDDMLLALMYLYGRGVTARDVIDCGIRITLGNNYHGYFIVPCYDMFGNLSYWFGRRYLCSSGTCKKRYVNPKFPRTGVIWAIDRWAEGWGGSGNPKGIMVICEGFFDAIYDTRCVALLGSKITGDQINVIKVANPEKIIVALDRDEKKKTINMCTDLIKSGFNQSRIYIANYDNFDYKDFGDAPKGAVKKSIDNAKSFSDYFRGNI